VGRRIAFSLLPLASRYYSCLPGRTWLEAKG
jgi:hypothetical protein